MPDNNELGGFSRLCPSAADPDPGDVTACQATGPAFWVQQAEARRDEAGQDEPSWRPSGPGCSPPLTQWGPASCTPTISGLIAMDD